jgi:hypothetical protein
MADTQTLSDPFKLPKGNADTSGKIPGQKDYNKNSQTKNTYKIDIPTRAGQTTGANENNPVAVYRVGVTQPIGTITSQSGFTPNPTYYSGVSAAEEKTRKAEQRAVREQTVEINKQVIKPTAEKAKIKPPIKNNDAATDSQSADKTTPAAVPVDLKKETESSKKTRKSYPNLRYPIDLANTKQDVIKFTMLEYQPKKFSDLKDNAGLGGFSPRDDKRNGIGSVILPIPSGISDTNSCEWGSDSMNALEAVAANAALTGITKGLGAGADVIGDAAGGVAKNTKEVGTGLAAFFAGLATNVDAGKILKRTEGAVLNPNMELLFNGPTLRPFSFTFKMSARSNKEAKQIIGIIRFFKQGMSPQKSESNLFLKSPNTFKIQYLHLGTDHPYIGRIKECALQSVTVSYTPEGQYATFYDGVMVSYEMQMQFTELEPIFNDDYGKGTGSSELDKEIGPAN